MNQVKRYIQEIRFSFQIDANFKSRFLLAFNTLLFHVYNFIKKRFQLESNLEQPKVFPMKLGNRSVNLNLRTYSGDLFVFYEVFLDKCYCIPPSWTRDVVNIVALGANVGLTTLFLSQFSPQATFICVEPDIENLRLLKHNVSHLGTKVKIIEGAVSSESGEVIFNDIGASWEKRLANKPESTGRKVRCFTIAEIIEIANLDTIDILKIDIEGAEELIFSTQEKWLKLVKVILIELHSPYSFEKFTKDMAFHGFTVLPANSSYGNRVIAAIPTNLLKVSESYCLI